MRMSEFIEIVNACFDEQDIANLRRAGREEGSRKTIQNMVSIMTKKTDYSRAEIATAMETVVDDLWREVEAND